MATFQESKVATNSSDANFRAWGKSISDGLTSVGVPKTSDTGQIDWATVSAPASASNTSAGYEIRKLNDALQATSPYFFKIEYGNGSTGNNPQIWITVGHITDGAGTLTLGSGQGSVVRHVLYAAAGLTASGSSFDINVSGSSSRFDICLWRTHSSNAAVLGFERAKDSSGADTDEYGTLLMTANSATLIKQYTLPKNESGVASPGTESRFLSVTTSLTSSSFNNKKAVSPIVPFIGKLGFPMTIAVGLKLADWITSGETFTSTVYGSTRTYMVITSSYPAIATPLIDLIAMRWD